MSFTEAAGFQAHAHYEIVVLGSGEGGKYLAWTMARQGKRALVIERKYIGGSCPNIACLPNKNVIHSAKVASYFFRSEEFGISKDNVRINPLVMAPFSLRPTLRNSSSKRTPKALD